MKECFVIATPLGNLKDISQRAIETLMAVDCIVCEDTRVSNNLLSVYGIKKPTVSLHRAAISKSWDSFAESLLKYQTIALITDAGTPGISDPGARFIRALKDIQKDIRVTPIPGPTAATALISAAGIPAAQWLFVGFLPQSKGRKTAIQELSAYSFPVVVYEAPHRLIKFLTELKDIYKEDGHKIILGRELTKIHETIYEGTATELLEHFEKHPDQVRGECVLLVIGPHCGKLVE